MMGQVRAYVPGPEMEVEAVKETAIQNTRKYEGEKWILPFHISLLQFKVFPLVKT
jgi:hypothetical protein